MVRKLATAAAAFCLLASCLQALADTGTVQSTDKKVQLTLPTDWETAVLEGAKGKLQAKCTAKNAFMQVISESKDDLTHKSLQEYADAILKIELGITKMTDRTVSEPKKVQIDGKDALQYEVRGTLGNVKLVYLKTFLETPTRWNQIIIWTMPSHWDEIQADARAIVESFKEIPK